MEVGRTRRWRDQAGAARLAAAVGILTAAATGLLIGCSSVPDEINPVEWYRGASAWVAGEDTDLSGASPSAVEAPKAEEVSYPNLASVPERPEHPPDPELAEDIMASLAEDRAAAKAANRRLRAGVDRTAATANEVNRAQDPVSMLDVSPRPPVHPPEPFSAKRPSSTASGPASPPSRAVISPGQIRSSGPDPVM